MREDHRGLIRTLEYPRDKDVILSSKVGSIFKINGIIVTARDKVHKMISEGLYTPKWEGFILMHAGPIVRRGNVISLGPTTSTRMSHMIEDVIRRTGVKVIIGKGGLGKKGLKICKELGCVYLTFTGGAAALGASRAQKVLKIENEELGETEAVYYIKVKEFGPVVVSIDTFGNDLYLRSICKTETLIDLYTKDV